MQPPPLTRPVVRTVALWPWPMPFGRMGLFVLSQALLALGFRFGGSFRFRAGHRRLAAVCRGAGQPD
jgi:hypothetical protein